jgi:uncharacterized membrane protein YbhN (UPF0104 family)
VALYTLAWPVLGLALWLLARGVGPAAATHLPLMIGAFALAWVAGFAVVISPGGLGVREAVLVGLLAPTLGEAHSILVAAASRIVFTAVDLAAAATGVLLLRRARARAAAEAAGTGPPPAPG